MLLKTILSYKNTATETTETPAFLKEKAVGLYQGILLTFLLALVANSLASLPFFSILGIMIISIILGMTWKGTMAIPEKASLGITFSSKRLLRVGIILMGVRLNLFTIAEMGPMVLIIDAIVIALTLGVMIFIGYVQKIDKHLTLLIGAGTAICGAAAIVAIAPLLKGSKQENTALSVACIAILGTFGALGYILAYPILPIDDQLFGVLVGSTLHELAHVVAAAVPAGEAGSETAIVVKLGRVLLLVPVALVISFLYNRKGETETAASRFQNLPIPWFIFGFLLMSVVNTAGWLTPGFTDFLVSASVFLMAMGMAGLGLSVNYQAFKEAGIKPAVLGVLGFVFLIILGFILLNFM